jgi:nucleotide-binding universal stress UspA family protein
MNESNRQIVVGYDGSQNARDALALAKMVAQATGEELVVTFVMRDAMASVAGWEDYKRGAHAAAEHEFNRAAEWLGDDVSLKFDAVPARSTAKGLLEAAMRHNAELIVVGSSHHGKTGQAVAGSVAERLLHGSHCPVAVAPVGLAEGEAKLQLVMAGYDDTDEGDAALAAATKLAAEAGARLGLVAVLDPRVFADYSAYAAADYESGSLKEGHREHLEQLLEQKLAGMPDGIEAAGEVVEGDPAEALAEAAQGADLLVLGSRGYGPLRSVLLGSVSSHIVREAPCAVMVAARAGE